MAEMTVKRTDNGVLYNIRTYNVYDGPVRIAVVRFNVDNDALDTVRGGADLVTVRRVIKELSAPKGGL